MLFISSVYFLQPSFVCCLSPLSFYFYFFFISIFFCAYFSILFHSLSLLSSWAACKIFLLCINFFSPAYSSTFFFLLLNLALPFFLPFCFLTVPSLPSFLPHACHLFLTYFLLPLPNFLLLRSCSCWCWCCWWWWCWSSSFSSSSSSSSSWKETLK